MEQLVELLGRADVLEQVLAQVQQRGLVGQGRGLGDLRGQQESARPRRRT